jgi:hypothetical protein
VQFRVGATDKTAQRQQTLTLTWRPADGAELVVLGFLDSSGNEAGGRVAAPGTWGLVRLLAKSTTTPLDYKGVRYQQHIWTEIRSDATGDLLGTTDRRTEASLLLRAVAGSNPLEPGFFLHTFAEEVFDADER